MFFHLWGGLWVCYCSMNFWKIRGHGTVIFITSFMLSNVLDQTIETQLWYFLVWICCSIWTLQCVPLPCILMWTSRSNSMRVDHPEIRKQLDKMCISISCALLALIPWEVLTLKSVNKNICADHPYYQCDCRDFFFPFYVYPCDWNAKVLQKLQFLFLVTNVSFMCLKVYVLSTFLCWYDRFTAYEA